MIVVSLCHPAIPAPLTVRRHRRTVTLKEQPAVWAATNQCAEAFLTPKRVARLLELKPSIAGGAPDSALLLKQDSSAILRQELVYALHAFSGQIQEPTKT